jgi:hypothetical protein
MPSDQLQLHDERHTTAPNRLSRTIAWDPFVAAPNCLYSPLDSYKVSNASAADANQQLPI